MSQCIRHNGAFSEPVLEAWHSLMKQHSETVDHRVSPQSGLFEQICFKRNIDDIGDQGIFAQWIERKIKIGLP